jgi:hypothetical protein
VSFVGLQGHHGAIFGYNTVFLYLPEADATFVVLTNLSTNFSEESMTIVHGIAKLLFPEQFPEN